MVERFDAQILFVPMEGPENKDPQHSHAVISKMANAQRANVLKGEYTSGEVLGLIKNMSFIVGMRLHFLIFAGIQKVPFVALPYASKVSGFLSDLEMPMLRSRLSTLANCVPFLIARGIRGIAWRKNSRKIFLPCRNAPKKPIRFFAICCNL